METEKTMKEKEATLVMFLHESESFPGLFALQFGLREEDEIKDGWAIDVSPGTRSLDGAFKYMTGCLIKKCAEESYRIKRVEFGPVWRYKKLTSEKEREVCSMIDWLESQGFPKGYVPTYKMDEARFSEDQIQFLRDKAKHHFGFLVEELK